MVSDFRRHLRRACAALWAALCGHGAAYRAAGGMEGGLTLNRLRHG